MMQRTTAVQSVAMHLRTASAYLYTRLIAMPMSVLHATTATASGLSYPSKKPSPACALLGLGTRKKAVTCGGEEAEAQPGVAEAAAARRRRARRARPRWPPRTSLISPGCISAVSRLCLGHLTLSAAPLAYSTEFCTLSAIL